MTIAKIDEIVEILEATALVHTPKLRRALTLARELRRGAAEGVAFHSAIDPKDTYRFAQRAVSFSDDHAAILILDRSEP